MELPSYILRIFSVEIQLIQQSKLTRLCANLILFMVDLSIKKAKYTFPLHKKCPQNRRFHFIANDWPFSQMSSKYKMTNYMYRSNLSYFGHCRCCCFIYTILRILEFWGSFFFYKFTFYHNFIFISRHQKNEDQREPKWARANCSKTWKLRKKAKIWWAKNDSTK